jgi:hypothetical protein
LNGSSVVLKDENRATTTTTVGDINQKNGAIHVIDSVELQRKIIIKKMSKNPRIISGDLVFIYLSFSAKSEMNISKL